MGKSVSSTPPGSHVRAVRAFNRFYTQRIGVLQRGVLQSPYSLTEVRVLYEIANGTDLTATDIQRLLGLDPGYLSRILRSFERSGVLSVGSWWLRAKAAAVARAVKRADNVPT